MGKRQRRRRHLVAVNDRGRQHAPAEAEPMPADTPRSQSQRRTQPDLPSPAAGARLYDPFEEVLSAVASGVFDDRLDRISRAVTDRLRVVRAEQAASVRARLRVGDRVRINEGARPKYLHGVWGTVAGWSNQLVVVRLDHPIGRFAGELRCPPGALDLPTLQPR